MYGEMKTKKQIVLELRELVRKFEEERKKSIKTAHESSDKGYERSALLDKGVASGFLGARHMLERLIETL